MNTLKHFVPLLFMIYGPVSMAQAYYTTYNGFTVPTEAILPPAEVHPSIWFRRADIEGLRNKKNADAYASTVWTKVNSLISGFRLQTPSATDFIERPRMAKALAFNWLMTGDTLSRRKAIECLLVAYDNVPRTATTANFDGDYDEIYRATWLQNYCAAYDWTRDQMTIAQDTVIRKKIITEVLLLKDNMVAGVRYASRPHNHRSKPAWGIVSAALTFTSDPRAAEWLTFGLAQANTVTKYQFSADGLYREGSHYLIYSLVNYLPYLWHYKNVSGQDHFQYYKSSLEAAILMRTAKGWMPNIEDSYVKPMPTHMFAAHFKSTPTLLHPAEPFSKILQWHWGKTNFFTAAYTGATNDVVWEIDEYITYDPSILPVAPDAAGTQKLDCGVVVFRDSANIAAAPTRHLLFHAVAECDNHQHADLLSYVMEYKGTQLSVDPGYGKDGYSDSKRSWYIAPSSHNVVTVNAKGPMDWSDNVKPSDIHFINTPRFALSEKQAKTNVTNGILNRGIAFCDNTFWAVYDLGSGAAATDYALNIHSRGQMVRDNNKITWSTGNDSYGTAQKLYSVAVSMPPAAVTEKTGFTSMWKDEVAQQFVELKHNTANSAFLHILFPADGNSTFPDITNISTPEVLALRVRTDNDNLIVLQQTNSSRTIDGFTTDANFANVAVKAGSVKRFAIVNGKMLRAESTALLSSTAMITLHCDRMTAGSDVISFDTLTALTQMSYVPSFPVSMISSITLNGLPLPYSTAGTTVLFSISGTGVVRISSTATGAGKDKGGLHIPKLKLLGNYPNPFNGGTRISFFAGTGLPVAVGIRDILGKTVRRFVIEARCEGLYNLQWDGKDDSGIDIASGLYLVHIDSGAYSAAQKCLFLK